MGRILFLVVLIVAVWITSTLKRRSNRLDNEERRELERLRDKEREAQGRSRQAGDLMVKCDRCGMYFPKKEAVLSQERVYCSKRCRDADEA